MYFRHLVPNTACSNLDIMLLGVLTIDVVHLFISLTKCSIYLVLRTHSALAHYYSRNYLIIFTPIISTSIPPPSLLSIRILTTIFPSNIYYSPHRLHVIKLHHVSSPQLPLGISPWTRGMPLLVCLESPYLIMSRGSGS